MKTYTAYITECIISFLKMCDISDIFSEINNDKLISYVDHYIYESISDWNYFFAKLNNKTIAFSVDNNVHCYLIIQLILINCKIKILFPFVILRYFHKSVQRMI